MQRSRIAVGALVISAAAVLAVRPAFTQQVKDEGNITSISELMGTLRDQLDRVEREPSFQQLDETGQTVDRLREKTHQHLTGIREKLENELIDHIRQGVVKKGYRLITSGDFGTLSFTGVDRNSRIDFRGKFSQLLKEAVRENSQIAVFGTYYHTEAAGEYLMPAPLRTTLSFPGDIPIITDRARPDFKKIIDGIPKTRTTVLTKMYAVSVVVLGRAVECGRTTIPNDELSGLCFQVDDGWEVHW